MKKIISFISEAFTNIKNLLIREYLGEAETEDAYSFRLLLNHLCLKNSQRVLVFAVISAIAGIICLFTSPAASQAAAFRILGAFILIASAAVCFWLIFREVNKRSPDYKLLKIYNYIFWISYIVGGIVIALSQYLSGKTDFFFVIFALGLAVIPIADFIESIVIGAAAAIPLFIYGIIGNNDFFYWLYYLIGVAAVLWISALNCNYASNNWLNSRRLETAEERCSQVLQKDALTGLLNKAGLSAKFMERYGSGIGAHKIAVILIDIDNFRGYNHMYGYDKSDSCLYSICNCIKIMAKPYTDVISRFGGDDFVLVLEDMDRLEIVKLAEQLREAVETMAMPYGKGIVTISIGISGIRELDGKNTYSDLLNEADDQLVIAKKCGKNCIGYMNRPFVHEGRKPVQN